MKRSTNPDEVVALLLHLVEFGSTISAALEAVAPPELARNNSLLTLSVLHLEGPRRPSDLQARTNLTSGGVTKLLERLEDLELVRRRTGLVPEDGRAVVVTITDTGSAQLQRLVRQFSDHIEQIESFTQNATELVTVLRHLGADDVS